MRRQSNNKITFFEILKLFFLLFGAFFGFVAFFVEEKRHGKMFAQSEVSGVA